MLLTGRRRTGRLPDPEISSKYAALPMNGLRVVNRHPRLSAVSRWAIARPASLVDRLDRTPRYQDMTTFVLNFCLPRRVIATSMDSQDPPSQGLGPPLDSSLQTPFRTRSSCTRKPSSYPRHHCMRESRKPCAVPRRSHNSHRTF